VDGGSFALIKRRRKARLAFDFLSDSEKGFVLQGKGEIGLRTGGKGEQSFAA